MRDTMASRAILMFWKEPRMWIFLDESLFQGFLSVEREDDLRIGENDTRPARVLDGEFRLAVLTSNTTYNASYMSTALAIKPV